MASNTQQQETPNVGGSHKQRPLHAIDYRINHKVFTLIAAILVALLAFGATVAGAIWLDFNNAVQSSKVDFHPQKKKQVEMIDPNAGKPITFLLIGQDTRDGANAALSGGTPEDAGLHQADTTMVVQVAANREYVNIVSIPRDSLVDVPSCETSHGTIPAQYNVMFNSIFSTAYDVGGDLSSAASCTVNAVNSLTGLDIQNFIIVDFQGLNNMIDAIGGVDVCIPMDTKDAYTDMDLKKGMQHLNGRDATNYARMRHGTGTDGSDIMRTTRQQYLVKSIFREAKKKSMLTQTSQLYQLAMSAIKSLNISSSMADTSALAGLAMSMKNLNPEHIYAQTVPVVAAPSDPNRVVWTQDAQTLWKKLLHAQPLYSTKSDTQHEQDEGVKPQEKQETKPSQDTEPSQDAQSTQDSNAQDGQSSEQDAQPKEETNHIDEKTGLIIKEDGTMIDPHTGGTVDPETGAIRDPQTNQYIGIADSYLNSVCAVK